MAQTSSIDSSIRYQVCNSTNDNDISRLSTSQSSGKRHSSISKDDLCEITIASPSTSNEKKISSNHHPLTSTRSRTSPSSDSTIIKIPFQTIPSAQQPFASSTSSIQSPTKPIKSSDEHNHDRIHSSHRATSKQSLFETLATTLTTGQKNSTAPLSTTQTDNANLFSSYQGDFIRQSRQLRKARRQDIKARFEKFDFNSSTARRAHSSRRFTFIFDPSGRLAYYWTSIISLAFLYNFWIIIFRFSFHELTHENLLIWFIFDYTCDFLYLMDIMFNFRTAYLEEGVLQTDPIKLRHYYMNTTRFYIDCLCLMPLDFLYLSIGFKSIVRLFRLVKIYRFWTFLDRTERHTNYPNLFRTFVMIHYLLAIFHWNACLIYILHTRSELGLTKRFSFTLNDGGLDYSKAL